MRIGDAEVHAVILINLLPHREAARKRRREAFQVTMFMAALIGIAIAGAVYWWYQNQIENQQSRNAFLQQEIKALALRIAPDQPEPSTYTPPWIPSPHDNTADDGSETPF